MANFVRDGVALDIPEAQLSLLKLSFDKADNKINELQAKLDALETITLNNKKYLADSTVIEKISELLKEAEAQSAEMATKDVDTSALESEISTLRMQIEELRAKEEALVKELEAASANSSETMIADRVAQRRKLERQVFPLLDAQEEVLEKMSDRRLKEEVITARYGDSLEALATRSDDAINAMFEIAVKHSQSDAAKDKVTLPSTVAVQDSGSTLSMAQKEYVQSVENAHKLIFS